MTASKDTTPSTAAASVVVFEPDCNSLVRLLDQLDSVFDDIVIIDNGGAAAALSGTAWEATKSFGQNRGMSHAMNAACEIATERGCQWVVHFDQDSMPLAGLAPFRDRLRTAGGRVGIVAESYVDRSSGRAGYSAGRSARVPLTPIAAGSAFRLAAWEKSGGFDEAFPVDLFDFAAALQMQASGWEVVLDPDFVIEHSVGDPVERTVLGLRLTSPGHAPWRTYLKLEATLRIGVRFGRRFPRWFIRHLAARAIETGTTLVFGPRRLAHFVQLLRWCVRRPPTRVRRLLASTPGLP